MSVTPIGGSTQIRLPEAVVSRKALHRLVTTNLHYRERVYPSPAHVRNSRMAEVVEVKTFDPYYLACGRKDTPEVGDTSSLPKKDMLLMQRSCLP